MLGLSVVTVLATQQGPVPVLSLIPTDFPAVAEFSTFSFLRNAFSLHFSCLGVGFSLIDATPEENCYVYVDGVDASALITEDSQEAVLNVAGFQVDVSDFNAPFSTLVYVLCEEGEDFAAALVVIAGQLLVSVKDAGGRGEGV